MTVRKSANVSPIVVDRILITQKVAVIAGTLFSQPDDDSAGIEAVVSSSAR